MMKTIYITGFIEEIITSLFILWTGIGLALSIVYNQTWFAVAYFTYLLIFHTIIGDVDDYRKHI